MKIMTAAILLFALSFSQSIVRVHCNQMNDLTRISAKLDLDIASARAGEWYDIVADRAMLDRIISSGLAYEIRVNEIDDLKDQARRYFHPYPAVVQMLRNWAAAYPSICKLDSLPVKTFQNRWIYALKISDNPYIEEESEPGMLVDGCHHAREWATIEVVLYFADHLITQYASSSEIRDIVDNTEIYCVPVVNVDGYIYDYNGNGELYWRWNREPFEGKIGTDCNRNYGCSAGDLKGDWGAADSGKATHLPGTETFCGPCANSGNEVHALTMYTGSRIVNSYMSYHSYGELLMWGWGFTQAPIPDAETAIRFGDRMAGMVNRVSGGTYTPGQVSSLMYYTSGASEDWLYSWMRGVAGVANLSYVTEVGYGFYPSEFLDSICMNNFRALKYLAQLTRDSIPTLCEGVVAPPRINDIGPVGPDFTVPWHPVNPSENHPLNWELVEYSNPSIITDSLESGADRWSLSGFGLSTGHAHSGYYSLFSGNLHGQNSAMVSTHPYFVLNGDSLIFWCYYILEPGHDVCVAEVSENNLEWFNVDTLRFTGEQTNWQRKAYSLAAWTGKSVFIRFRCMYDDGTEYAGFWVDDIWPACRFDAIQSISQNITDTIYQFTGHSPGTYYYQVRGRNAAWDWGGYSSLKPAVVSVGIADQPVAPGPAAASYVLLAPNPARNRLEIRFGIADNLLVNREKIAVIRIYNAAGILVKTIKKSISVIGHRSSISWDLTDSYGRIVPNGVYYISITAADFTQTAGVLVIK
jgi:carboxypeptidase T